MTMRTKHGHGGNLRGRGEECGDRRRRTFINVRRPHVERNGRNLEGKAGKDEDQSEDQAERRRARSRQCRGDLVEAGVAGEAVDQRHAIKQHARRQRAEDEILQAGFRRTDAVAVDGGYDVERQRLQFQRRDRRDIRSLAEIISSMPRVASTSSTGNSKRSILRRTRHRPTDMIMRGDGADQRQHLHELGEGVGQEGAAVSLARRRSARISQSAGDGEQANRKASDQPRTISRRRRRRSSTATIAPTARINSGVDRCRLARNDFSSHVQSRPVVISPKAQRLARPARRQCSC